MISVGVSGHPAPLKHPPVQQGAAGLLNLSFPIHLYPVVQVRSVHPSTSSFRSSPAFQLPAGLLLCEEISGS